MMNWFSPRSAHDSSSDDEVDPSTMRPLEPSDEPELSTPVQIKLQPTSTQVDTPSTANFGQLHRQTCLAMHSIKATAADVMRHENSMLPMAKDVLLYDTPDWFEQLAPVHNHSATSTSSPSLASTILSPIKYAAGRLWSPSRVGRDDHDDSEPDDDLVDPSSEIVSRVLLEETLSLLSRHRPSSPLVVEQEGSGKRSWRHWLASSTEPDTAANELRPWLLTLAPEEMAWIVQLAARREFLTRVERPQPPTLLVLGASGDVSTAVTLYDLTMARERLEQRLTDWQAKEVSATRLAAAAKQRGDSSTALHQLRRRAILRKTLDQLHGQLLNVEQCSTAVELAAEQHRNIFPAVEQATSVLRQLRTETSVESVGNLMGELQEELQEQEAIHAELAGIQEPVDEDDLINELSMMMLQDQNSSSSGGDTPQKDSGNGSGSSNTKELPVNLTESSTVDTQEMDPEALGGTYEMPAAPTNPLEPSSAERKARATVQEMGSILNMT